MAEFEGALRADARANRERILDVAREALKADPEASLNSIAKAAGVGAGTLYRHFPNRGSLILGVYRHSIDVLVAYAPGLLREYRPLEAFRLWCARLAEFGRAKHSFADALHAEMSERDVQETYWPMVEAVRQLVQAGEKSGDFCPGNNPEDILVLLSCLGQAPSNLGRQRAGRKAHRDGLARIKRSAIN